jgi:hypothetical protein
VAPTGRSYPDQRDEPQPRRVDWSVLSTAPPDWLALCWLSDFVLEPNERPGQLPVEVAVMGLAEAGLIDMTLSDDSDNLLLAPTQQGLLTAGTLRHPFPWACERLIRDLSGQSAGSRSLHLQRYVGMTALAALSRGWGTVRKVPRRGLPADAYVMRNHWIARSVHIFVPTDVARDSYRDAAQGLATSWASFVRGFPNLHAALVRATAIAPDAPYLSDGTAIP